jgi:hypothetical protein
LLVVDRAVGMEPFMELSRLEARLPAASTSGCVPNCYPAHRPHWLDRRQPERAAYTTDAVAFLARAETQFVTGATWNVDGGYAL